MAIMTAINVLAAVVIWAACIYDRKTAKHKRETAEMSREDTLQLVALVKALKPATEEN